MIKNITKFVFALLLSITYLHADVVAINGVEWEYCDDYDYDDDYNYEIIGVAITGASQVSGELIIPSKINGRSVTSIYTSAFGGCSGLTSVTIPDSVTRIYQGAFSGCSGLTSVTIGNSVTSIDSLAFEGCSSLTSITIPDSVTSIDWEAFSGCSSLTSVTIPESVEEIGDGAFEGCSGLTSVTIGNSVTSIGPCAFSGCSGLTSVTIPDSVTSIGHTAFYNCINLKSINLGNGIKRLGWNNDSWEGIFEGCINLTNIKIPASVEEIGEYAFKGCDKIIYDLKTIPGVKILDGWVVGYTKDCPSKIDLTNFNIADGAFYGCTVLTSVKLSNSLKQIGYHVFMGCRNLTSITIPNSVTSIRYGAFVCCSGLTSVTIPNSVTWIGDSAFSCCSGLTSVTIPNSVTSIGDYAFAWCDGLTQFIVGSNNPSFKSVNGLLLSKDGTSLIAGINRDVVIPNGVTRIYGDAFYGYSGLTSVTIPESVEYIGDWAFSECRNLKSAIFLGDAPEFVGDDIFDNCADGFVIKVKKGTKGWNGDYNSTDLPATWQGYPIIYTDQFFYKVAFNANGGTGKMAAQTLIYDRAANLNKNAFTRSGYTFLGWAKSATGAVVYKNAAAVKNLRSTAGTVTLYARWAKTKYKIAFYANGGTGSMSAQTMTYNKAAYLKNNAFKRSGYTFLGWAKSATGAVVYKNAAAVKNLTASGATIKLYARWAKTIYKIAYYANGGKGLMATQTLTYNKAAYLTKNAFKRTGYVFAGWAKSATGSVVYTNGKAVKNLSASGATIKLYAKWKPISYTIAFNANGGSGTMANQAMTYNKAAYLQKNAFTRSECMFLGWATTAKGAIAYKNAAAVKNLRSTAGTITLYARWAKTNYQIAFNANGGSGTMANQVMTYNKAAYLTTNTFKRTGYTFQGWAKSATGAVVYKNAAAVKNLSASGATINLYAIWKPITYKIAFNANGGFGSMASKGMIYNKAAYLSKNAFTRSGYVFIGWAKSATGAVAYKNAAAVKNLRSTAGTITLYARWAKSTYKVAFYANGGSGSMSAQAMTYNKAAYLKKNAFKRTGYTFKGWAKSPTGSVVYTNGKAVKNLTTNGGTVKLYAVWLKFEGVQLWEDGPYWAETNVGAENPWDYGYYFWWGDTIGYKWENNKWVASDGSSSNFSFEEANAPTCGKDYAAIDNEGWTICSVLAPKYDAARAHLGENWRMPTESEFDDLCDNCIWTWTTINGVEGYIVSGKGVYSDASIFLPAAGYGDGINFSLDYYTGPSDGCYWSSVARSILSPSTSFLEFDYDDLWVPMSGGRYLGYPVRPVLAYPK